MQRTLIVLCLLAAPVLAGSPPANPANARVLRMSESERKAAWALFLRASGESCDSVTWMLYLGTVPNGDAMWSVACHSGTAVSVLIAADAVGTTKIADCAAMKLVGVDCWKAFPKK